MINALGNWWRSHQFKKALKQGDQQLAQRRFQEIRRSGVQLSWLETLYENQVKLEYSLQQQQKKLSVLKQKLSRKSDPIQTLELPRDFEYGEEDYLKADAKIVNKITETFKLIEQDETLLQCTGIDENVFEDLEYHLAQYIQTEFDHLSRKPNFSKLLDEAVQDISRLKIGEDPSYNFTLSPHVYFIRYFLDNVYCAYLAWFLIYQFEGLPTQLNILDIAAGPGTILYGLDLFLRSLQDLTKIPQPQICYYSLEKQDHFQYRGLQFWRKYIEQVATPSNAYFRFDTVDLLQDKMNSEKFPDQCFDFITICHCLFYDPQQRKQANLTFKNIFKHSLKKEGYILFIVQDKKFTKAYNLSNNSNFQQENDIINCFLNEMDLRLVWYKHLTSTGQRKFTSPSEFGKFAREHLHKQKYISPFVRQFLKLNYDLNYTLDDYIIVAQRKI